MWKTWIGLEVSSLCIDDDLSDLFALLERFDLPGEELQMAFFLFEIGEDFLTGVWPYSDLQKGNGDCQRFIEALGRGIDCHLSSPRRREKFWRIGTRGLDEGESICKSCDQERGEQMRGHWRLDWWMWLRLNWRRTDEEGSLRVIKRHAAWTKVTKRKRW